MINIRFFISERFPQIKTLGSFINIFSVNLQQMQTSFLCGNLFSSHISKGHPYVSCGPHRLEAECPIYPWCLHFKKILKLAWLENRLSL